MSEQTESVIKYKLDFGKAQDQVKTLTKETDKLKTQEIALKKAFDSGKISSEQYNKSLGNIKATSASLSKSTEQLSKSLVQSGANFQNLTSQLNAVSGTLSTISGDMGTAAKGISGALSIFTGGGIVAGVTTGIGIIVKYFQEWKEKAKEAAQETINAKKALSDLWAGRDKTTLDRAIELYTKQIEAIKDLAELEKEWGADGNKSANAYSVLWEYGGKTAADTLEAIIKKRKEELEKDRKDELDKDKKAQETLAENQKKIREEEQKQLEETQRAIEDLKLESLEGYYKEVQRLENERKRKIEDIDKKIANTRNKELKKSLLELKSLVGTTYENKIIKLQGGFGTGFSEYKDIDDLLSKLGIRGIGGWDSLFEKRWKENTGKDWKKYDPSKYNKDHLLNFYNIKLNKWRKSFIEEGIEEYKAKNPSIFELIGDNLSTALEEITAMEVLIQKEEERLGSLYNDNYKPSLEQFQRWYEKYELNKVRYGDTEEDGRDGVYTRSRREASREGYFKFFKEFYGNIISNINLSDIDKYNIGVEKMKDLKKNLDELEDELARKYYPSSDDIYEENPEIPKNGFDIDLENKIEKLRKEISVLKVNQALSPEMKVYDKYSSKKDGILREADWSKKTLQKQLDEVINSIDRSLKEQVALKEQSLEKTKAKMEKLRNANMISEEEYINEVKSVETASESFKLKAFQEANEARMAANMKFKAQEIELEKDTKEKLAEIDRTYFEQTSGMFSELSSVFTELSDTEIEGSKKWIKFQKAAIYLSEAAALANGVSTAMKSTNWIEALAAAASITATLIGTFNKIKSIESKANYAKGGLITGEGSGTSDSIRANLSNGESVINARATSMYAPLLSAVNQSTGGAPIISSRNNSFLARELALAISAQPAPIVSVQDINTGQNRVRYVRTVGSI